MALGDPPDFRYPFQDLMSTFGPIMPIGPTVLELAQALRECFAATQGVIPCGPLDKLIAKYDVTFYEVEEIVDGD